MWQQNGKTSAGRTRWRCKNCGASQLVNRQDVSRKHQIQGFVAWLLGKSSQQEHGGNPRLFRTQHEWCWDICVPQPPPSGEIYRYIMVDGTYLQDWCVLIAYTDHHVVAWQWCDHEKKAAWKALLAPIPAPDVVITDGGSGLRAALDESWQRTRIQRCYFHIYQNVRRYTTMNPSLQPTQEIWALTTRLMHVETQEQAAQWLSDYAMWESTWHDFLKERSYPRKDQKRPRGVSIRSTWWYTHRSLRSVRASYRLLIRDKALFTWLEGPYLNKDATPSIPRTTSALEGGVNKAIKDLCRHHRGLPSTHAKTAIDWLLNSLTEHPYDPWHIAQHQPTEKPHPTQPETPSTRLYDQSIDFNKTRWTPDLHIRKGWAGRSH